jgi:hypothetical protein
MMALIYNIQRQSNTELNGIPYANIIEASGGVEEITVVLLECICDEIKMLEGKVITAGRYARHV